jgi:hypothetical protein
MKQWIVVVMVVGLALTSCAKKKVELVYDEPITNVWTDRPVQRPVPVGAAAMPPPGEQPPPAPGHPSTVERQNPAAMPAAPASVQGEPDANPTQALVPPPAYPTESPVPPGAAPGYPAMPANAQQQPPAAPPSNAWRNKTPPPGFPDESVTTYVVPDPNPTTQTTLKRKGGWVRGGYD